jgi:hypothetical protein
MNGSFVFHRATLVARSSFANAAGDLLSRDDNWSRHLDLPNLDNGVIGITGS